ncbi:MAG: hypothetical protein H6713_11025 [Myxococcales bacterium]|nr:hypothetical protein [Myxococcales bacterium]MCB9750506.1 hypothetical protein [Myxococcales bacterium]
MNRVLRGAVCTLLCIGLVSQPARVHAQDAEEAPPDPETLSDKEKLEWAKKLYLEAKEHHDNEDYYHSVIKYEQAYGYAPDKHIFAYNLGVDAWELKDCARVKQYLQLFLIKDEEHEELQADAREILKQAEGNPECITGGPGEEPPREGPPPDEPQVPGEIENPLTPGGPGTTAPEPERKGPSGMLIGGVILTIVGAGAVAGGVGTLVVGKGAADELSTLSTPGVTGFVGTEYDDAVMATERKLATMNTVSPILLAAGGALLAGGVALLVVDSLNRKHHRGHYANARGPRLTGFGVGPVTGGAAASLQLRF